MNAEAKTHFRKAFDSPYLSSADITEPTVLTIHHVTLELDRTKKTKDKFNTAWFAEKELRPGETLKPMILNATNSKTLKVISGSPFLEDWANIKVSVYVDPNVRFGKEVMEGLRIKAVPVVRALTPTQTKAWENAKAAYRRDGNLQSVLARVEMSEEHQRQLMDECAE
jgi:hypothetical protein